MPALAHDFMTLLVVMKISHRQAHSVLLVFPSQIERKNKVLSTKQKRQPDAKQTVEETKCYFSCLLDKE
jgi:hypothetical protein